MHVPSWNNDLVNQKEGQMKSITIIEMPVS